MWGTGTPALSHPQVWAEGCRPRGLGAWLPRGWPGAGGAEQSPGRQAEPRWDGPTRRGREAASRGPPLLKRAGQRPRAPPPLAPSLIRPLPNNGDGAAGVAPPREGGGVRFGTGVQGGGRGGSSGPPLSLLGGDHGRALKPFRDLGQESNSSPHPQFRGAVRKVMPSLPSRSDKRVAITIYFRGLIFLFFLKMRVP